MDGGGSNLQGMSLFISVAGFFAWFGAAKPGFKCADL
jgi:hypothetical protein